MRTKNISTEDAHKLCSRAEDHFFDRKSLKVKPAKIQKVATAFANADGGEIAIGIADDRGEPDRKSVGRVPPLSKSLTATCRPCPS